MIQGSEEWIKERLGKATASRFSDVMAKIRTGESAQRRNYRAQLVVERLTGVREDGFQSNDMQWGIDTEPLAAAAYMLATGNDVEECGFIQHASLMAGASPDRLIGAEGTLELKCPKTATHIAYLMADVVPSEYVPQMQGQMWIAGRKWCDFASFDPRMPQRSQLFIKRLERDEEYIKALEAEVILFLSEVDKEVEFLTNYKGVSK